MGQYNPKKGKARMKMISTKITKMSATWFREKQNDKHNLDKGKQ
jgi:hypothetical protein